MQQSSRATTPTTPSDIDTQTLYYDAPSTPAATPNLEPSDWMASSKKGKGRALDDLLEPEELLAHPSEKETPIPPSDVSIPDDSGPPSNPPTFVYTGDSGDRRPYITGPDEHGWLPAIDEPHQAAKTQDPVLPDTLTPQRKGSVLRKKPPLVISSSSTESGLNTPRRSSSVRSRQSNTPRIYSAPEGRERRRSRSTSCPPPQTDTIEPPKRSLSKRSTRSVATSGKSMHVTPIHSPPPSLQNHTPRRTLSKRSARHHPSDPQEKSEAVVVVDSTSIRTKERQKEEKRRRKKSVLVKNRPNRRSLSVKPANGISSKEPDIWRDPDLEAVHQAQLTKALLELSTLQSTQRDIEERVARKKHEVEFLMGKTSRLEEGNTRIGEYGYNEWSSRGVGEQYTSASRGRSERKNLGFGTIGRLFHGSW